MARTIKLPTGARPLGPIPQPKNLVRADFRTKTWIPSDQWFERQIVQLPPQPVRREGEVIRVDFVSRKRVA